MNYSIEDITLLILAGGQASRMQGDDKGLIHLSEKSLTQHLIDNLKQHFKHIIISANRNIEKYSAFGFPVVTDSGFDATGQENLSGSFYGPLAGMLAGLKHCKTNLLATVPCDAPFVDKSYFDLMLEHVNQRSAEGCVAFCDGKIQPVFTVLNKSLEENLQQTLASGIYKVQTWLNQLTLAQVHFDADDNFFLNLNTPEDFEHAEKILNGKLNEH